MQGLNKAVLDMMQPNGVPDRVRWAGIEWKITRIVAGKNMIHIATTNTENNSESWIGIPNEQIPSEVNTLQIIPDWASEPSEEKEHGYVCKDCGNSDQTKFNLFFEQYCDRCGSRNIERVEIRGEK